MLSMMKITRVQTQRKQINVKVKKVRHAMKTQMTMPNPMRRLGSPSGSEHKNDEGEDEDGDDSTSWAMTKLDTYFDRKMNSSNVVLLEKVTDQQKKHVLESK